MLEDPDTPNAPPGVLARRPEDKKESTQILPYTQPRKHQIYTQYDYSCDPWLFYQLPPSDLTGDRRKINIFHTYRSVYTHT